MKRLLLVPALGVVGLALASPAQRAARRHDRPESRRRTRTRPGSRTTSRGGSRTTTAIAKASRKASATARSRDAFNYQDERTWQRADKGYHRSFGDSERYQQSFRTGYAAGYSDGVSPVRARLRLPRQRQRHRGGLSEHARRLSQPGQLWISQDRAATVRPVSGGYGYSPAYSNGTNDGYEKGREDARDRDSYDPLRHKWYREGDHDYKSQYGPRQQYENVYRAGVQGRLRPRLPGVGVSAVAARSSLA